MRLIDADALKLNKVYSDERREYVVPVATIDWSQTVEATPVVHSKWEQMHYEGGIMDGTNADKCTACGFERVVEAESFKTTYSFCPNCGSKMD